MKATIKPFIAVLALASILSVPASAAVTQSDIQDLSAQAAQLKKTLASLQNQVSNLQDQVNTSAPVATTKNSKKNNGRYRRHLHSAVTGNAVNTTSDQSPKDAEDAASAKQLRDLIVEEHEYLPFDMDVPGQAFVSTGPYVGVPFQFAGSDLIVNTPSIDIDVQLLNIRKSILKQLNIMGGEITKEPYHSHLLLSGVVETSANYFNPGGRPSTTDIDVTNTSLDLFMLGPSEWILGFIGFTYNNNTPATDVFGGTSQYRVADSRVFVNNAFVTIGNFTQSPMYATFGQFNVPFGQYSSVMVSTPLTTLLARTKARAIEFGFRMQGDNGLYGATYIFRGDSHATSVPKVNNGGLNLGLKFKRDWLKGRIGGGVIANIADSSGMQLGANFQNVEQLVHRVPAYNAHAQLSIGTHIDFIAEYVGAATRFNPNNMSYKGHGAQPTALDFEAAFNADLFESKPSSIAVGYQQSQQALALGLPLNRVSLVLNTSWWRNTLQSLEFRRDREYAASDTATGAGNVVSAPETGKIDKSVIAQFDYYF